MDSTERLIEELVRVVRRELQLIEKGERRAPQGRSVKFPLHHAVIEELLVKLGYGGKQIYVRKKREPVGRIVEEIIRTDYARGANVFSRRYTSYLKVKLKELGVEISENYLESRLAKTRKELRRSNISK